MQPSQARENVELLVKNDKGIDKQVKIVKNPIVVVESGENAALVQKKKLSKGGKLASTQTKPPS